MYTKLSVLIYFSLLFFSMFMQIVISSWYLLIPIILLSWKLVSLSINKKGDADEIKTYICPLLVIIGFCSFLFILPPKYLCYGCRRFTSVWYITFVPLTTVSATLSWFGFIGIAIRNQPNWIFFAILNVITTWFLLYNIAGFLWISNILRW